MVSQLVKVFLLFTCSYLLLVDFPDGELINNFVHSLRSFDLPGIQYSRVLYENLILTLSTVSTYGILFFIRNQARINESDIKMPGSNQKPKSKDAVGKTGKIKSIDGDRFISVSGQLYKYESKEDSEIILGNVYTIKNADGEILII